ncbi:MAG: ATP phosphoribosyltransferase regulatory subunit [Lachnospiraceae bacterium]|nr:ATP phosphoribosyltransferase regulatory subunit [Lachnospiraceae bacterium]
MRRELTHTPEGVRDLYGESLKRQMEAERRIEATFTEFGYEQIRTPALEYADLFDAKSDPADSFELFRYFDRDGGTMVLRPDFTPSVARTAVKYFLETNEPLRLFYQGSVFNNRRRLQGKLREETQMGAEFYNDGSVRADAEIIALAIRSLLAAGMDDIRMCIGHVDYFYGICEEAGIDKETEAELLDCICEKNAFAAEKLLADRQVPKPYASKLLDIAGLFSGVSDLDALAHEAINKRSKEAIDRLKALYEALSEYGVQQYVTFDLGLLNRYRYYTGVVFRAYTNGIGEPIARGGRYDALLEKLGRPAPAVGFMVVTDDLSSALAAEKKDGLTIALGKGRLAKEAMALLNRCGIFCPEMEEKDTRKLIFTNGKEKLSFFLAKGPDVPTYVEYGAADIGIVGADTILEENRRVCQVLDLKFGACRMCVCGRPEAAELLRHHEMIRVATKYPEIAKSYFYDRKKQTVELIKLNGSVELGPIVGLADVIVDIVETGSTLRENGLEVLEEICPLSARLIVNPVSIQLHSARIRELVTMMREQLGG